MNKNTQLNLGKLDDEMKSNCKHLRLDEKIFLTILRTQEIEKD